ncbi:MAG: trigger factor [Planctomycetota bacterium]|jgi:trigger factor
MEVQVDETGPCRKTLTIKVPPEKIQQHIAEVYKTASSQVQIKGFRPGKVPRRVLQQRFGAEILKEAKESLINDSFQDACREHEIAFIGQPDVQGVDEAPLNEEQPLEFQVHLDVHPEFEVKNIKGIEVKAESTAVTEEDIENGLAQLAKQKRSLKVVDEPVEDGDFVKGDLVFRKDDQEILTRSGAQLNTNIPVAGTDQQVFADKLRGAEKGTVVEMEIKYPDTFEKEEVRGQEGTVQITVDQVMRVVAPPVDDELAKGFDYDNLDALKEDLQKRIGEEKVAGENNRRDNVIIDTLLNDNPFALPHGLVADQKQHLLKQLEAQMRQGGADDDAVKQELVKHNEEAEKESERRVRVFFLLEAIAKKQKIFVTEGDVDVELRNIAAQNNVTPEQAREHYKDNDLLGDLRLSIMERKVREFLRENAKITDN